MIKRSLSQADGSEEKISQKVTVVNLPIYHEPISPAVGAVGIIHHRMYEQFLNLSGEVLKRLQLLE